MCDLERHAADCDLLGVMLVEVGWTRKAHHLNCEADTKYNAKGQGNCWLCGHADTYLKPKLRIGIQITTLNRAGIASSVANWLHCDCFLSAKQASCIRALLSV